MSWVVHPINSWVDPITGTVNCIFNENVWCSDDAAGME
jgi:hypothetical protein